MKPLDIVIDEKDGALWAAAIDQNGRLFAVDCDCPREEIRWGSIFLGKVETIDKKLDACWVSLGEGFMGLLPHGEWPDKDKAPLAGSLLIVQAKTGVLRDEPPTEEEELEISRKVRLEPKVTRLSTDITLPGRYMIFAAKEKTNRLSRRVTDAKARKSMMRMLDELSELFSGCILRASAENTQTDMLIREGNILQKTWEELKYQASLLSAPQEMMVGPNAVERLFSDMASFTLEDIHISLLDHMTVAESWCETFAPDLVTKIAPVQIDNATDDFALFDHLELTSQIEDLLQPYVLLREGGNLIIQETAALTAVDVNRGGDQVSSNLELNRQAAEEIGRQLRLRNLGGIVIVDFINMKQKREQEDVISVMERAVAADACTVQVHGMSALGLLELTRQRRLPALAKRARH